MSATIKPFTDEFEEYGRDESRSSGEASSISFPTSEDEVRAILRLSLIHISEPTRP